jgi:hypothetical protein
MQTSALWATKIAASIRCGFSAEQTKLRRFGLRSYIDICSLAGIGTIFYVRCDLSAVGTWVWRCGRFCCSLRMPANRLPICLFDFIERTNEDLLTTITTDLIPLLIASISTRFLQNSKVTELGSNHWINCFKSMLDLGIIVFLHHAISVNHIYSSFNVEP